jgi:hypothetical protein
MPKNDARHEGGHRLDKAIITGPNNITALFSATSRTRGPE